MQKIQTQDDWITRAHNVLPAGGFGNFDPNIVTVSYTHLTLPTIYSV